MFKNLKYPLIIILVGILAWHETLNFWFFKGYEATWLMTVRPHTFVNLLRGHGFLYYLDWRIFGWNPWGWYLTSLVLHLAASALLFHFLAVLTKNKILAFIASIIFVANTSYNDVLTWGSFNSYYPLLLILMLLALLAFYEFKKRGKIIFLFLSLFASFLGFLVRETGIVIVPLITIFDLIFSTDIKSRKTLVQIIKRQIPFYIIVALFFVIRAAYGGVAGDTADSNVKMQIRFVQDKLYVEYAKASFLTFGRLIAPQIIPYPILNFLREILINIPYVYTYFFSILGWFFYLVFGFIAFITRRRKHGRLFLFFWCWIGIISLFVSSAVPFTSEFLIRPYEWITMRYRYFAFAGTSVLIATFLMTFFKRRLNLLVFGFVFINLMFIWKIENEVYSSTYKPGKEFYSQFNKNFPTLPNEAAFYIYPHSVGLSDYLLEWYFIKDSSHPNLKDQPFRIETQIAAVMGKVKSGKVRLRDTFFLDYNKENGLFNKTTEAKAAILNQKDYVLKPIKSTNQKYTAQNFTGPVIETPYNLDIEIESLLENNISYRSPNSALFRALVDYNIARKKYLDSVKIKTSPSLSQRDNEPFLHVVPSNLIDGNIGERSSWIADAIPAWIEVDLGNEEEIYAATWGSQPASTRTPASYSFLTSNDRKTWKTIHVVKNNSRTSVIEVFEKPVTARYIKMIINTTTLGEFAKVDEIDIIGIEGKEILQFYADRDKLLEESRNVFQFISSQQDLDYAINRGLDYNWGKLSWTTNIDSSSVGSQSVHFKYPINHPLQKISVQIPEGEVFAGSGQFLSKYINSISLDFGEVPIIIDIHSLKLTPRIKL